MTMISDTKILIDDDMNKKEEIINKFHNELCLIMTKWCDKYKNNCSGGEMRSSRGKDIEEFVINTINYIGQQNNINIIAIKGDDDKKLLQINKNNKIIKKNHQVDVHIYLDNEFIAIIECKAYLDSCYYVRACDDFALFKKFNYQIKNYIFTLENSIDEDTKDFTDYITDNICDNIYYMLDGKRSSSKPIYDIKYKKVINRDNFIKFINNIYMLAKI